MKHLSLISVIELLVLSVLVIANATIVGFGVDNFLGLSSCLLGTSLGLLGAGLERHRVSISDL